MLGVSHPNYQAATKSTSHLSYSHAVEATRTAQHKDSCNWCYLHQNP